MKEYEIRVIRKGTGATIYSSPQVSDFAAIRRARLLAEDGDIVEVWRGLQLCLHPGARACPHPLTGFSRGG